MTSIIAEFSNVDLAGYGLERFFRDIEVKSTNIIGDDEAISKMFSFSGAQN